MGEDEIVKAYRDGVNWAKSLKKWDKFLGAMPAAREFYEYNTLLYRLFIAGALDSLPKTGVACDENGIIKEDLK